MSINTRIVPDDSSPGSVARTSGRASGGADLNRSGQYPALWLFDFDNTIVRLEPAVDWAASRRELEPALRAAGVLEELFFRFPRGNLLLYDAVRGLLLGSAREEGSAPAGDSGGPATEAARAKREEHRAIVERASAIIEKYELLGVERAAPMQGAEELLRALRSHGSALAIVTSNSSRTVGRWLKLHGLTDVVRVIVGRDSLLALKPAPDMIIRALEMCAVAPSNAVFVGDSAADLGAASAAGVRFYGVTADPASRGRLLAAGASKIFASPAALAIHLNLPGLTIQGLAHTDPRGGDAGPVR